MKKLNLKTTAEATRKDSYTMNPAEINVYWEENPREDYGDEEFEQLKELIRKDKEIYNPLFVTPDQKEEGKWKISHGFRRMKAIIELREEGINIESVPVKAVYNEEEALLLHITLNNSTKALTDVELAKTIREYSKMTGIDSHKTLSEKTGLSYAKVRSLMGFDEMASTQMKEAVKNDEISFTAATQIIHTASSISEQNEVLNTVRQQAQEGGKKRATGSMVSKATGATKINKHLDRLRSLLIMNGNYAEVVRVIDYLDSTENSELLTILKTPIDAAAL